MPIDPRKLRSQRLRSVNYQGDALRLGMDWTEEDLAKPQVLVDSAYGMGHPGTFHFRPLIEEVSNGVFEAGGKPAVFTVSLRSNTLSFRTLPSVQRTSLSGKV